MTEVSVAVPTNQSTDSYAHWSEKPVTPGIHDDIAWYPSMVYDTLTAYCSCGEWKAYASTWTSPVADCQRDIRAEWRKHAGSRA